MSVNAKTDAELLDLILKTTPSSKNDVDVKDKTFEKPVLSSQGEQEVQVKNETEDLDKMPYKELMESDTDLLAVTSDTFNRLEQKPYSAENQDSSLDFHKTEDHNEVTEIASNNPLTIVSDVENTEDKPIIAIDEKIDQNSASTDDGMGEENFDLFTKQELIEKIQGYVKEISILKKQVSDFQRQVSKKDNYNEVLRTMVEKLSSQLHSYKTAKCIDTAVQVDKTDLMNYTLGEPCLPDWGTNVTSDVLNADSLVEQNEAKDCMESSLSIADSLKMVAQDVVDKQNKDTLLLQGYVYDETYQLYYHSESGFYYDPEKMLYYDPNTGIYYYYDYDTGQYAFHSQISIADGQSESTNMKTDPKSRQERKGSYQRRKHSRKHDMKSDPVKDRKSVDRTKTQDFKNRRERRQAIREKREREKHKRLEQKKYIKKQSSHRVKGGRSRSRERKQHRTSDRGSSSGSERASTERKNKDETKKRTHRDQRRDKDPKGSDGKKRKSCRGQKAERLKLIRERKQHKNNSNSGDENNMVISEDMEKPDCNDKIIDVVDISDDDLVIIESDGGENSEGSCMEIDRKDSENVDMDESEKYMDIDVEDSHRNSYKASSDGSINTASDTQNGKQDTVCKDEFKTENNNNKCKRGTDELEQSYSSESESGELTDSSSEETEHSTDSDQDSYIVLDYEGFEEEGEDQDGVEDIAQSWPPCVRVIVMESDCVAVGMLYIVTYQGVSIGRGKENGICLPDINISKCHAEIKFNEKDGQYVVVDKGSQNGTFLNGERISQPKTTSEPKPFCHGDIIQVDTSKLLCHIHPGTDTCDDCEPGVVMAKHRDQCPKQEIKFISKEEKKKLQRKELQQIKKKYGLKNAAYEDNPNVFNNQNYEDKAAERRKTVGSEAVHTEPKVPASVHRPISSENKGHKMLEKMGWKEGESLGKNNSGIQEPISVSLRIHQSAGLGSAGSGIFSADDVNSLDIKKASRRVQAMQRYSQLEKSDTLSSQSDNVIVETNEKTNNTLEKSAGKYKMTWTKGDTEFT